MKRKSFATLVGQLLIPGCSQESIDEQLEIYLSNKG